MTTAKPMLFQPNKRADVACFATARRRPTLVRLMFLATLCLLLVGCSTLNTSSRGSQSAARQNAARHRSQKAPGRNGKGFFSWFQPEEPKQPKSVPEWMDATKPIRP
jgi:hypothetical protein